MRKALSIEAGVTTTQEQSNFRILLAEDSQIYQRLIDSQLKEWGFSLVSASNGKEAWKLLCRPDAPRLALLDWVLPEIEGLEICRRLRERPETLPYTYTILLTAKSKKEEMLQAMEAGADDFLPKPFDPPELKARLLVGKRIVELQQRLVSANQSLQFSASHDFLTGLWNRREILDFLQREIARSGRDCSHIGIVLADIDHFKQVNDHFGHDSGDLVLKTVATSLNRSLREYDGVGRYGGEEFLLVIPRCDLRTTLRRANEIRESVAIQSISLPTGAATVTLSMGVVAAESSTDLDHLIRAADKALYAAKRKGRNRVESGDVV
jgi:two-component system, cell cycle response regulator